MLSGKFVSVVEELSADEELEPVDELELLEELSVDELELLEELVELDEPSEQALRVNAHIAAIKAALNLFLIFIE